MGKEDRGPAPGGRGEGTGRVVHHQGERQICGALCRRESEIPVLLPQPVE